MRLQKAAPSKLILTEQEIIVLREAKDILNEIATLMDRAISVDWSLFDDDEIWGACEIIESFLPEIS